MKVQYLFTKYWGTTCLWNKGETAWEKTSQLRRQVGKLWLRKWSGERESASSRYRGGRPHEDTGPILNLTERRISSSLSEQGTENQEPWKQQIQPMAQESLSSFRGFPAGSDSDQESACKAWDPGSTPGLGRTPGEGKCNPLQHSLCFPAGSDSKESTCSAVNLGLIPGLGRSPGEGNGYPLQYSCLENSRDRGAWWAMAHGVAKSGTPQLSN